MSAAESERLLAAGGDSQLEAAPRLRANRRSVQRWVAGDCPIPEAVAQLVVLWPAERGKQKRKE